VLLLVFVRDYKTVALAQPAKAAAPALSARRVVAELLRPRTALITCIGAGLNLLVVSTIWAWLPSYFNRYYGLAPDRAGAKTAVVVLLAGVGAVACSALADRLSSRIAAARLVVPAVAAVLTSTLMIAAFALAKPGDLQFALILAGSLVMAGSVGPTDAAVIDVSHPALRATAVSVLSLTRNLFGLAGGPLLAGALSDRYGLTFALATVPLFGIAAAAFFLWAARTYPRDVGAVCAIEGRHDASATPQAA